MALATIVLTETLPPSGVTGSKYTIKGTAKAFDTIGAPPFIYAVVKYKEWYKPDWAEDKDYLRGWPSFGSGDFAIDFMPEKEGEFEVEVIGTPAPLSLPIVGAWPSVVSSDVMKMSIRQEVIDFTLTKPTVAPAEIFPGGEISITCPVTSNCEEPKTVTAKIKIYEGSVLPGHGTLLTTKTSSPFTIAPDESYDVVVNHTAKQGTIDRRDIGVEIYIGTEKIKSSEWDDVYYVTPDVIDFDLTRPMASPAQPSVGETVSITCPVTSKCNKSQSIMAKVKIYEGSALPGHGTLITTKNSPIFTIAPGASYDIVVDHIATQGTIDRRDVGVEIYVGSSKAKDGEWDDVFYVTPDTINFNFTKPIASPAQASVGQVVTITCPVTSLCTKAQTVTAKVYIYEGSALSGHGALLDTKTISFGIQPNQTYDVVVTRTAAAGTIDRRDVGIEILVGGTKVDDAEWDDIYYVTPDVIDFTLTRPTASPAQASVGQTVTITCPVKSNCTKSQSVTARILIYEGSALSGHGTLLDTKTANFSIAPGQSYNVQVTRTTVAGTIDRRDIGVELYINASKVKDAEWDDVYYVTGDVIDFNLTKPTALPVQAGSGQTVTLTCPVKSNCSKTQSVTAKIYIYEGSIWPGHGTLLDTKTVTFSIAPNQSYNVVVNRITVAGTIDRRDVGVALYIGGTKVKDAEWDDIYYVSGAASTLSASFSDGVVSYSFSGFQPNATITIQVVGGGYVLKTANSSGAGSGSFNDGDPAGTYTLRATDSYGHIATAVFTIPSGPVTSRLNASYSNGVVSYSFSGFQPNATVIIQVVGGGYVLETANSSGAGNGALYATEPPGTYTLRATDSYNHVATAPFIIT